MHARHTLKHLALGTLSILAVLLGGCGDDDPTAPGGQGDDGPRVILVLGDGGTETHVTSTLAGAGFEVRDGGPFHDFDGSGLDDVHAVVLLTGVEYNNDMNDDGEWALVDFVTRGGGLVTTEWLNYSIERSGFHQVIQAILPVTYGGSYSSGSETYAVMVDHPVTAGLPETFTTSESMEYSELSPRDGAVQLVRGSDSGHAVVTWTVGGRVVSWNMAGEYGGEDIWSDEMDRLLMNAVDFVSEARQAPAVDLAYDTVEFEAFELTIIADGDGPAGSTSSPGDFFITVRIAAEIAGEEVELARRERVLVQAVDNEIVRPGITVSARLPRVDGQRFVARISYYENDPDGPQQSAGAGLVYAYDAANECWERLFEDSCLDGSADEFGDVFLEDYLGDPLNAELTWRLSVD
jgi:hypothetical protein